MSVFKSISKCLHLLILLALLLSSAVVVSPVSAATIVVTSNLDVFADDGVCTLREAIHNANNNIQQYTSTGECAAGSAGADVITFASDYTITLTSQLRLKITSEITIAGRGSQKTIIQASTCDPIEKPEDCTPANHGVIEIELDGYLTLKDVTIRHGNAYSGAGIFNRNSLILEDSIIISNQAEYFGGGLLNNGPDTTATIKNSGFYGNRTDVVAPLTGGGAISNHHGTMVIQSSNFVQNSAPVNGGGILNLDFSTLTVTGSSFSFNTATADGGAIFNNGNLTVTGSSFYKNEAELGGGIRNEGWIGKIVVSNTSFSENKAIHGGAIDNDGQGENLSAIIASSFIENTARGTGGAIRHLGNMWIINSTLSGNQADNSGGGIWNKGRLWVDFSTLTGNTTAPGEGGGIHNAASASLVNLNYSNTIIANSTGGECVNHATIDLQSTHNLVQDGSCNASNSGDPKLGQLKDNGGPTLTHALLPGSPAIDAADMTDDCPPIDQRGVSRPQGKACDIGAFEFNRATDGGYFIYLPLVLR